MDTSTLILKHRQTLHFFVHTSLNMELYKMEMMLLTTSSNVSTSSAEDLEFTIMPRGE